MYSVELFSQVVAVLYHRAHGFPLATYGENVSLGAGNLAILACFAKLNRESDTQQTADRRRASGCHRGDVSLFLLLLLSLSSPRAVVSLLFPVLLSPLVRFPALLSFLQSLSIPLNIASKLPQILINASVASVLRKQIDKARAENARLARLVALAPQTALACSSFAQQSDAESQQEQPPQPADSTAAASTDVSIAPPALHTRSLSSSSPLSSPSASPSSSQLVARRLPASQLSPIPFALNFLGSFSRLYTTMTQLSGDRIMLLGFIISCALNGAIVAQCAQLRWLQRRWAEEREKGEALAKKRQ